MVSAKCRGEVLLAHGFKRIVCLVVWFDVSLLR